jgi:hypothetical protein
LPCRQANLNSAAISLSLTPGGNGEPGGTRTRDPLIKSQMLYRLSYRPLRVRIFI